MSWLYNGVSGNNVLFIAPTDPSITLISGNLGINIAHIVRTQVYGNNQVRLTIASNNVPSQFDSLVFSTTPAQLTQLLTLLQLPLSWVTN